jgi:hypothetical protein
MRQRFMNAPITHETLRCENVEFLGTGGRSQENAGSGFRPAFLDRETDTIYPSRFADGTPASVHLLEGLPAELVTRRTPAGRVQVVKASVVSGFVLAGRFYTREAAARKLNRCHCYRRSR